MDMEKKQANTWGLMFFGVGEYPAGEEAAFTHTFEVVEKQGEWIAKLNTQTN